MDYESMNQRIESITSFEGTIARINQLNLLLLEALAERSRFPLARIYFESTPQRQLEAQGIDTVWWSPVYSVISGMVSKEGDFEDGVVEAESRLELIARERIFIAKNVIRYKAPRGMEITRRDREEQILLEMRLMAQQYELSPDSVEGVFKFVMQKNKDVQQCMRSRITGGQKLDEVGSCRTAQAGEYTPGDGSHVDNMRRGMQLKGNMLSEKDGMKYYTVFEKVDQGAGLPVYVVKLVRE